MTLNETLASLGFTTAPAGSYRKHIIADGVIVFTGTANDVWQWIGSR